MSRQCDAFLPSTLPAGRMIARIGLISNTDMPARNSAFPASLFNALRGVDMALRVVAPALAAELPPFTALGRLIAPSQSDAGYMRLAHRCWSGALDIITPDDLLTELHADESLSPAAASALISVLTDAQLPQAS